MQFSDFELSDQFFWYLVRSSGVMAYFAAGASVLVGLLLSSRLLGRKPSFPWLNDLHRFFSSMLVLFVVVHMVALLFEEWTQFGVVDILVPGHAAEADMIPGSKNEGSIRLTLAIIAFWLLVIVEGTSLIKKHLPKKLWHSIHLLSFPILGLAALHGYQMGSDADNIVLLALSASMATALVMTGIGRLFRL